MKTISTKECAVMIREALKQGFPNTKFSVKMRKSTYNHNIGVRWTDGPTEKQVKPILERFKSSGFDSMTDCSYSCGNRMLAGEPVEVYGNYVDGSRSISDRLRLIVAEKLIAEARLDNVTLTLDKYGDLHGCEQHVPYQWHASWNDEPFMTLEQFESAKHILAHDQYGGEWLSQLIYRVENHISLEEQKPIDPVLLPEYVDVNETVSTGRAEEFEPRQKMFEGHAALETAAETVEAAAIASFEAAPVTPANVPPAFHCSIGRSYPRAAVQPISGRIQ